MPAWDVVSKKASKLISVINMSKAKNPIRVLTFSILRGDFGAPAVRSRDFKGEVDALFGWVNRRIRYTRDPTNVDIFEEPEYTVKHGAGDCDAMVTVLGSMLSAAGHPVALKIVSYDGATFSHVYLLVADPSHPGQWIPLDPTLEGARVGKELPYAMERVYAV